ncbi:MAG: hypothetical protein LBM67_01510 [Lentimicrobiaceae bacterium]|jgi:hypothetical protein|nr:hypothetical protein [Lentimicrobiaceae bacterium]
MKRITIIALLLLFGLFLCSSSIQAKDTKHKKAYVLGGTNVVVCDQIGDEFLIRTDLIGKTLFDGKNKIVITDATITDFGNKEFAYLIISGESNTYFEDSLIAQHLLIAHPVYMAAKNEKAPPAGGGTGIITNPTTHACIPGTGNNHCACCEFNTNSEGKITGCKCGDCSSSGLFPQCGHSISTVQSKSGGNIPIIDSLIKYFE